MRRLICSVLVLLAICGVAGCAQSNKPEICQIQGDRLRMATSVNEMLSVSDLIVVFTPTKQENILSTFFSDGDVAIGYTKTSGEIDEVLYGSRMSGDTISVTEVCYTTDSGSKLWTFQGYLPMEIGMKYVLFLKEYADSSTYAGMYYPVEVEYGKYLVSSDAALPLYNTDNGYEQLQVGAATDLTTYTEWYDTVRKLYPDVFVRCIV